MATKNGVAFYVAASAKLYFPEGHVCCDLCPVLETYARKQCRLTGEYLLDTRATVGYSCPLEIHGMEDTYGKSQNL